MKNHNDKAMENYFNSMLSEKTADESKTPPLIADKNLNLNRLAAVTPIVTESIIFPEQQVVETQSAPLASPEKIEQTVSWKNLELENEFQVLFFQLSGLTFAVPLIDLGGIHHLDASLNSLIGKPAWFLGVMARGESLYNIVDTAKWIGTGETAATLNYSHYILLGSTPWGLSCEKLLGTETLTYAQVEWRKVSGKRPWLAGMVKDKMCALIHAPELIKLLKSGVNIHGH